MDNTLKNKVEDLESFVGKQNKIAVAFSGGVDSTFLLFMAKKVLGEDNIMAITGNSFTMPLREIEFCKKKAMEWGIKHLVVKTQEYLDESYVKNGYQRCYFCKISLFKTIRSYVPNEYGIVVGTNADDAAHSQDRPGMMAEREFDVAAPLKEILFFKNDIRAASKYFKLDTWDKPQMACLASRIPFGSVVTEEKIRMVSMAEDVLREKGFIDVRVRHYGKLAKIEVPAKSVSDILNCGFLSELIKKIKEIGFKSVALDLEGMNHSGLNL